MKRTAGVREPSNSCRANLLLYLQGVPGVQSITDPEGKRNDWQKSPGEVGDRDI